MKPTVKFDAQLCIRCKRCLVACAVENSKSKNLFEAIFEEPAPQPRLKVVLNGRVAAVTACRHCDAAICIANCPTGAMHRDTPDGPVVIDKDRCIGCGNCVLVCPYGAPRLDIAGERIDKCDLCIERVEQGLEPACVS
ncbi:MAG: 4Fe-4S dicluster domain-containing protein, partial [Deltaproteobacteria bacterium]|nr:4Fe-4S dicluster domain-containing protein [Deltaproteobacteria bacterium]